MINTLFIGMSGLTSYSNGLHTLANNVANLNTPGFKSSSLQFADLFYANGNSANGQLGTAGAQAGHGVTTTRSSLNFSQGELRQTGNTFDLAVDGAGLFVLRDSSGALRYTRAGQFEFDAAGTLIEPVSTLQVMGRGANGALVPISLSGHHVSAPKATGTVKFSGNLSSTEASQTISGVKVIDAKGVEHALSLVFTSQDDTTPGRWKVDLTDGTTNVGSATLDFVGGIPKAGAEKLSFKYTPKGLAEMTVVMDFSSEVTSYASGTLSTLAAGSQDGYVAGSLSSYAFDAKGVLQFQYSNGQKAEGPRLALAGVDTPQWLSAVGGNAFEAADGVQVHLGNPGDATFGLLRSGSIEISNVDLSREFSDMVIMQRGYQASSQVISTANEMLQELFGMRR